MSFPRLAETTRALRVVENSEGRDTWAESGKGMASPLSRVRSGVPREGWPVGDSASESGICRRESHGPRLGGRHMGEILWEVVFWGQFEVEWFSTHGAGGSNRG